MRFALLKYDLCRVLGWWIPAALVVWLIVLFDTAPLPVTESWLLVVAQLLGLATAWPLFSESSSTLCYVFTRGMTRSRIFWSRWLLGMAFLGFMTATAWALIALGPRAHMHRVFEFDDAVFFPMVRDFESSCVVEILKLSAVVYCLTAFVLTLRKLLSPRRTSSLWGGLRTARDMAILTLAFLVIWTISQSLESSPFVARVAPAYALFEKAFWYWNPFFWLAAALCTWSAAHIYRHLEIPA
ncbi:MAG: hypothetical protein NT069_01390 [Planctomycetota bacterium]|nr:hypothetical protein [Planctomycetota bacterium]